MSGPGNQCAGLLRRCDGACQGTAKAECLTRTQLTLERAEIAPHRKRIDRQDRIAQRGCELYSGGEYWLYRFKKYTDVRLVFAPEEQTAFFGGDYDNFTYPRYCLDVTFFRVYENGAALKTQNYLKWSASGAGRRRICAGDRNPGSTNRLLTVAQLQYQRDMGNPLQMQVWTSRAKPSCAIAQLALRPRAAR